MQKRDVLVGIIVVVLLLILFTRINNKPEELVMDEVPTPTSNVEKKIEDTLGIKIADEGDKIELSNGDAMAVVTKNNGKISIIADLPDLAQGEYYEAVGLGKLIAAKGGYILNSVNAPNTKEIVIKKGEETILQGSFQ